jgi:hypothetical protein
MIYVTVALIAYAVFYQWIRYQRRLLIHRERLAAAEKGLPWPAFDEAQRSQWAVQRLLILAGIAWISMAIGLFVLMSTLAGGPPIEVPWGEPGTTMRVPPHSEWTALAPLGIGLAHLLVYAMGRTKEP